MQGAVCILTLVHQTVGIHAAVAAGQLITLEMVAAGMRWLLLLLHSCLSSDTAALTTAGSLILSHTLQLLKCKREMKTLMPIGTGLAFSLRGSGTRTCHMTVTQNTEFGSTQKPGITAQSGRHTAVA
jgi:hypothetical protein